MELKSLTDLIAEDLDLACSSVDETVGARAEVVRVDLQVQRDAFYPLLRGEVCAERIDANIHLRRPQRE